MRTRYCLAFCVAFQLVAAWPAAAQPNDATVFDESTLKPGEFVWQPERSASGPVEIVVSLGRQLAYVFRSGELIGLATISSGTETNPTPDGRFRILQKKKVHFSSKYDDAPMPNMMRLTWYGIALHAGQNPGYPASHGCIRLPAKFAEKLFAVTPLQSTVIITHDAPATADDALALARTYQPPDAAGDGSETQSASM